MTIGENKGKVYGLIKYPQKPNYGWLSRNIDVEGNLNIYDDNINFADLQEYPAGNTNLPY